MPPLVVAVSFAFWQNEAVLKIVDDPLEDTQRLDRDIQSQDPVEHTAL